MNTQDDSHIDWCSDKKGAEAFARSQTRWLAERQKQLQAQIMSPANALRYQHGGQIIHPADEESSPSDMQAHSAISELKFEDVLNQNVDAWAKGLVELSEEMHKSFMGMVFENLNDVTARTGNVVDAREAGSFPKAMLEMMQKIELAVGRDGEVSMPTIAAPPELAEKQIAELEAQPPAFKEEFERIKQQKIDDARQREAERIARFKGSS
jgi:hypothetical protein